MVHSACVTQQTERKLSRQNRPQCCLLEKNLDLHQINEGTPMFVDTNICQSVTVTRDKEET